MWSGLETLGETDMRKIIMGAAMGLAAVCLLSASASLANDLKGSTSMDAFSVFGREASEGPRGEGQGHPVKADTQKPFEVAREASEGPRGEGQGHPVKADTHLPLDVV